MNWDALGAFVELAGAVGVIVTLVYLASQIKTQNRESRLSASRELSSSFNDFLGDLARDAVLSDVFIRGCKDLDSLSEVETMQFYSHLGRTFRLFETMHKQNIEGRLDSSQWNSVAKIMQDYGLQAGFRDWWVARRHWYSPEFQSYVDPILGDA